MTMRPTKRPLPRPQTPLTFELMRQSIATHLGVPAESVAGDDDLIRSGLDSIGMMRLSNSWRRHGVEIKFAELVQQPTLAAWWELAAAQLTRRRSEERCEVDESAPFELTPMQQAYWIGSGEGQVLGSVGAQYYVELDGAGLEPARLERAVLSVQSRHAMLRARFLPEGRQQVSGEGTCSRLVVHDLRELGAGEVERALEDLRESLAQRRLAVERGEVFNVRLTLLPGAATRLHISITMLVCDARSFQIILEDLARLYSDPEHPPAPLGYSFQQYLQEKARRRGDAYERAKAYWQERLPSLPGRPLLPLATAPAALREQKVGRRFHRIAPEQKRALAERAKGCGLSLPVVFATAFAEVLGAWSGEQRFLLNLPLFDREEFAPEAGLLVGDFTNMMVIGVDVSADLPFREQAKRVQARLVESAAHSEYAGVEVLRDLARTRTADGILAPVVFTSVIGMGDLFGDEVRRCLGSPAWITSQTPQVWLDHQVIERDGGLLLNVDFVEGLFPAGVVDDLFRSYVGLLGWLGSEGSEWGKPVPPPLPRAQAEVRAAVNATRQTYECRPLHSGFFERAAERPDATALAWGDDASLSYGALARRALSVAAALVARGVAPGDPVGITLPRGPQQVVSVLGVLAAGAVFVPVALDQPAYRRAQIYENAGTKVILTRAADTASSEWAAGAELLPVETAEQFAPLAAPVYAAPDSLAYIIYTSGSTGQPKGVEMTHRAAANTVEDINRRFGVAGDDRILAVSALEFDLSIYDIFGPLSAGAAVVLVAEDEKREAGAWLRLMRDRGVTLWNSVPALLDMLLTAGESEEDFPKLRAALVSGDWVGVDLPRRLAARAPGCRFVALGGATEAAIWSIAYEVDRVDESWRSVPYGRPLSNQRFRVVDGRGRDCPDFVPGELWIGGAGVAAGYRNEPALTAERFVTRQGERWYRTGDLGRYWPDGTIEFLGRSDLQVKVHGHRIELGEIESALGGHPQVARAVAFAAGNGGQVIAAAVVPLDGEVDPHLLKMFAADRLPFYMAPRQIFMLERLPLTANGKVDRQELSRLLAEQAEVDEYEPPRPGLETSLAGLWGQLLGQPDIGRHSNFMALGGDSLSATRLLGMIRKQLGAELTLRQLMMSLTLSDLTRVVSDLSTQFEEGTI